MDLFVADVVQQDCWSALAALQPGDQVMLALRHMRWDRAFTERADWLFHGGSRQKRCHPLHDGAM